MERVKNYFLKRFKILNLLLFVTQDTALYLETCKFLKTSSRLNYFNQLI